MNSVESCEQKDTSRNCNLLHCPSNLVKKKKKERDLSNEGQKTIARDTFVSFLFLPFSSFLVLGFFFFFFMVYWENN